MDGGREQRRCGLYALGRAGGVSLHEPRLGAWLMRAPGSCDLLCASCAPEVVASVRRRFAETPDVLHGCPHRQGSRGWAVAIIKPCCTAERCCCFSLTRRNIKYNLYARLMWRSGRKQFHSLLHVLVHEAIKDQLQKQRQFSAHKLGRDCFSSAL